MDLIIINGKPENVVHANGKQFTSKLFRCFLTHNQIDDKQLSKLYPQPQEKIEVYNKIVKNEFLH
jgi:hypothetical protein